MWFKLMNVRNIGGWGGGRPDVIALTDAFDVSDRVLNSALGRSDGKFNPHFIHFTNRPVSSL